MEKCKYHDENCKWRSCSEQAECYSEKQSGDSVQVERLVRPLPQEFEMTNELKSKWVTHVIGQDDIFDQPDEIAALRYANEINLGLVTMLEEDDDRTGGWPLVFAVAKQVPVNGA